MSRLISSQLLSLVAELREGRRFLAVVLEDCARPVLEAAAEIALTFGPRVSIDEARGALMLDVSGCLHLHDSEESMGEKLVAALEKLSRVKIAFGDGPRLALVLAQGGGLDALGLDEDSLEFLHDVGVRTIEALLRLPRAELEERLPSASRTSLQLARGEDHVALKAWAPPEKLEAAEDLEHSVAALEPLLFVIKRLVDSLCARLEARGELLAQAELSVRYERRPGLTQTTQTWQAVFPSPLRDAKAVLSVLKLRLEAQRLQAPVREVRLSFTQRPKSEPRTLDLWSKDNAALLSPLIAELVAELGEALVGSLIVEDRYTSRTTLGRIGTMSVSPPSPWVSLTYLLSEPLRTQPTEPWTRTGGQLLMRQQGIEWWTCGFFAATDSTVAWVDAVGATAWLEGPSQHGWLEG